MLITNMRITKFFAFFFLAMALWLSVPNAVKAGGAAASAAIAGSSRVKGLVRMEGAIPKAKTISMAADPSCAKLHASPVLSQEVLTDAKGDLQNVIVFVSEGLADHRFVAPTQPAVINQKGCLYEPHVIAMQANQPLHVVNGDQTSHNIHPTPANNREWNKAEPPGTSVDEAFAREEIAIPIKCNVHPWMRGYVAVFKHPFFAVTGKDGSFDLSNLPPGTYTLKAWHEKFGTATQTVTLGANDTKEINFVFKPI